MTMALALVLISSSCCAQGIPGLGTDPLKKGPLPPLTQVRTDPPNGEGAQAAHTRALSELKNLIDAAAALRSQLETDGPNLVRVDAAPRLRAMKKALKAVESALKPR